MEEKKRTCPIVSNELYSEVLFLSVEVLVAVGWRGGKADKFIGFRRMLKGSNRAASSEKHLLILLSCSSFTSIISNLSILSRTVSSLSYLRSLQPSFSHSILISPIPSISQISRYFPCFRYKRIFWLTPGLTILKWEDSLISCPLTH